MVVHLQEIMEFSEIVFVEEGLIEFITARRGGTGGSGRSSGSSSGLLLAATAAGKNALPYPKYTCGGEGVSEGRWRYWRMEGICMVSTYIPWVLIQLQLLEGIIGRG